MIIERIIFNVIAFALFVIIFFKMIYKNDTSYTYILVMQALGIAIGFVGLIFRIDIPIAILIFTYILSVLIPLVIVIFEKKGIYLSEIIALNMAIIYYNKNDIKKAKEILMKKLEKYPNSYYLHKKLAQICEQMGDMDIAIDEYIKASDINKEDYKMSLKVAQLINTTDRGNEAIRILNDLLQRKPDYYEASCLLGDILYEQENYKEAINIYMSAISYNPDKYELYYNIGMTFTRLNDFQSAKEYYEKAAQLNSILYRAKFDLAQISLLYNEIDEAEKYFEECINDDELSDEVYYYLSYIYMIKRDKEKAIQFLNIAVEENEELYRRACKEDIFKPIISKINKPTNTAKNKNKNKITIKELATMKHLRQTCEVVANLSKSDIRTMQTLKRKSENERE